LAFLALSFENFNTRYNNIATVIDETLSKSKNMDLQEKLLAKTVKGNPEMIAPTVTKNVEKKIIKCKIQN